MSYYGEQTITPRLDTEERRFKNGLFKIASAALIVFFSLHLIFTLQYALYYLGIELNWDYEIIEKIIAFMNLFYYLFKISRIIMIILLGVVLWLLTEKNQPIGNSKLKIAAIIVCVSFIFDFIIRFTFYLTAYLVEVSSIQSILLLYAELMFISLNYTIWIQIAKIIIGVEFRALNKESSYQTKMMIAPIINTILLLPMIATLVFSFFTNWGILAYLFIQPLYGLIGIIGSIEFQKNGKNLILEKEMEISREPYETRISKRRGVANNKQMLVISVTIWIGNLVLGIIYSLLNIVYPITGSNMTEIWLRSLFGEVISIISFLVLILTAIALFQIKRKITTAKYRTYLTISFWLFLANTIVSILFNVIFYINLAIAQLASMSTNTQIIVIISLISGIMSTLLTVGAIICFGLFLLKMRKEKGWKTNLLVMPFIYIGVYAISNITLLVVELVLKLSENPMMILAGNLVNVGLRVLFIGMVVELLIRVINLPEEGLRELTGELLIPETTEKYQAMGEY